MSISRVVDIRLEEAFGHFPRPPIVEAVIDIRARPTKAFEESGVRMYLEKALSSYCFLDSQREYQHNVRVENGKPASQQLHDLGWRGTRFQSEDKKHISQFNRDGFVISRLSTYESWQQFSEEGVRLWKIFKTLAEPSDILRVGLRFINRIPLPPGEQSIEDFIHPAPAPPGNFKLPFINYLHHDTLAVPGHPYAINVIQTVQPAQASAGDGVALILDIDVFTTEGIELSDETLSRRLLEMRWLKNKVFFGSITDRTKELFR